MNYVLLLGAGFSRNWGGWLADEVFEYLLGHTEIVDDQYSKNMLWKYKESGGFEYALAEIQYAAHQRNDAETKKRQRRFESAISQMFDDMNESFSQKKEFNRVLQAILTQFDAIFTLNQDLLLEGHYHCGNGLSESPFSMGIQLQEVPGSKWSYWQTPGVAHPDVNVVPHSKQIYENKWVPTEESGFKIEDRMQPYFKLHGSCNWRTPDGSQLLIMGGNKENMIKSYRILSWYHKQFEEFISKPDTRLMIIGYSFRDTHINNALISSAEKGSLQLFVIDPIGVDAIGQGNSTRGAAIKSATDVEKALYSCAIGASRRPLLETFESDNAELKKVIRFFGDSLFNVQNRVQPSGAN